MVTIDERLDEITQRLDLVAAGAPHAEGHILIALSNLLEVVREQQRQIDGHFRVMEAPARPASAPDAG